MGERAGMVSSVWGGKSAAAAKHRNNVQLRFGLPMNDLARKGWSSLDADGILGSAEADGMRHCSAPVQEQRKRLARRPALRRADIALRSVYKDTTTVQGKVDKGSARTSHRQSVGGSAVNISRIIIT